MELEVSTENQRMWQGLLDKEYIGLEHNNIRAITPKKKPPRGRLTVVDKEKNVKIPSARVIIEKYFGRRVL